MRGQPVDILRTTGTEAACAANDLTVMKTIRLRKASLEPWITEQKDIKVNKCPAQMKVICCSVYVLCLGLYRSCTCSAIPAPNTTPLPVAPTF